MKHNCIVSKCQHESVKYCKTCLNVYCEDCNETWATPCMLNHYYYTDPIYPTYPWYITTSNNINFCGSHTQ